MVYDGGALVAEQDSAGATTHRYIHGNDAGDDPLVRCGNPASGWRRVLLADHQGSIVAVADMYGNPVAIDSKSITIAPDQAGASPAAPLRGRAPRQGRGDPGDG